MHKSLETISERNMEEDPFEEQQAIKNEDTNPRCIHLPRPPSKNEPLKSILKRKSNQTPSQERRIFRDIQFDSLVGDSIGKPLNAFPKKRKSDDAPSHEENKPRKRHFDPPTNKALPRIIKIHDPLPNDDEYFKSLIPSAAATNAVNDAYNTPPDLPKPDPIKNTDTVDNTFVIVRVHHAEAGCRAPEVVGVYSDTAEAYGEAQECLRRPMKQWKVYGDDEVDVNDPSVRASGVEHDGSHIYVYRKPLKGVHKIPEEDQKAVYVVNRTYYGEYFQRNEEGEQKQNDILGVFDTVEEANEAAPKLLEQDYEGKLHDQGIEGAGWEEYEEEILENGSICIRSEGRVGEFFHVMIGKEEYCEGSRERVSRAW